MYRKEVNERSPLRLFERSIHGGLGRGNVGIVISRAGVGKSAFLVGIAIDDLLRERKVLHVSIGDSVEHVRNFYDGTFLQLVENTDLARVEKNRLRIERNRHIHSYQPGTFSVVRLSDEVRFLDGETGFLPDLIVIDNFPPDDSSAGEIADLRAFAREWNAEVWLSVLCSRETPMTDEGYPDPVASLEKHLSVKLFLEPVADAVRLRLLKDHENQEIGDLMIELDPTTLLLKDRATA